MEHAAQPGGHGGECVARASVSSRSGPLSDRPIGRQRRPVGRQRRGRPIAARRGCQGRPRRPSRQLGRCPVPPRDQPAVSVDALADPCWITQSTLAFPARRESEPATCSRTTPRPAVTYLPRRPVRAAHRRRSPSGSKHTSLSSGGSVVQRRRPEAAPGSRTRTVAAGADHPAPRGVDREQQGRTGGASPPVRRCDCGARS